MRQKEIAFEFFPDPDLPNVSGLSDQIRQVVLNLFLNAIEVMQPGGRLTVQTRGRRTQNEVFFSVKDTGPGIDPEILPRIFDPFITSKQQVQVLGSLSLMTSSSNTMAASGHKMIHGRRSHIQRLAAHR